MKKSNFIYLFVSSSNRPSEVMQASIRKLAASQPLCCREDFFSPQSSLTSVCLATGKKMHGICLYFSKRISYIKNLSGQYPPPLPPFCVNHTRQYTGKNLPVFFSQFAGGYPPFFFSDFIHPPPFLFIITPPCPTPPKKTLRFSGIFFGGF